MQMVSKKTECKLKEHLSVVHMFFKLQNSDSVNNLHV